MRLDNGIWIVESPWNTSQAEQAINKAIRVADHNITIDKAPTIDIMEDNTPITNQEILTARQSLRQKLKTKRNLRTKDLWKN